MAGETRETILEVALARFAAAGYAAVSMRDIAEAVGVRPSALYNHFARKQDILACLMEGHLHWLLTAWEAARPPGDDPLARLDAFAAFHVRHHIDRPQAVFLAYMELRSLEADNRDRVNALRAAYEADLRAILSDGAERGLFAVDDAHVAAMAIIAMLTGVTTWYRPGGRLDRDSIIAIYVGLVRRSVGLGTAIGEESRCSTGT